MLNRKTNGERGSVTLGVVGVIAVLVVIGVIWVLTGLTYATEGTRLVVTQWGKTIDVLSPQDGTHFYLWFGYDFYEVDIKASRCR